MNLEETIEHALADVEEARENSATCIVAALAKHLRLSEVHKRVDIQERSLENIRQELIRLL